MERPLISGGRGMEVSRLVSVPAVCGLQTADASRAFPRFSPFISPQTIKTRTEEDLRWFLNSLDSFVSLERIVLNCSATAKTASR